MCVCVCVCVCVYTYKLMYVYGSNNVERLLQQGVERGEVTDIRDTLTRLLPLTQDMLSHFQQLVCHPVYHSMDTSNS